MEPKVADDAAMQNLTVSSYTPRRDVAMAEKVLVTNPELLSMSLASEFDPAIAGAGRMFQATCEIPSIMILGCSGPNMDCPWEFTYHGCPKCNLTKLGESGTCAKCGGSDYEDRYLIKVTIIDPTDSVEGVMFHDAAKEFLADADLILKPVVALAQLNSLPSNQQSRSQACSTFSGRRQRAPKEIATDPSRPSLAT